MGSPRKLLHIAQIAPLYESVPPRMYGGTARVVSYLCDELVRHGHRVTLFASGDSHTAAQLVPVCDTAIRLDARRPEPVALHILMMEEVTRRAADFDVLHFHTDGLHLPLARHNAAAALTTLHGRLDRSGFAALYSEFDDLPLVSVSDAQRAPLAAANWAATVHHGLPLALHRPTYAPGKYLAFLGRIAPEQGVERAIEIARRSGIALKIAAKIDAADAAYWSSCITPLIEPPLIEYVGEISEREKSRFLGDALALLFPIDWPEPFGLAMIEALACGTPVIAMRRGSVPEILDSEITGCIVDSTDAAVASVARVARLDRRLCRRVFEQRFSSTRMALDYCDLYYMLAEERYQRRA